MSQQYNKRPGHTEITSVSVTRKFKELMVQYDLSPTEIFRKGVAASLCDLGVPSYSSDLNEKRVEYINKFLASLDKDEALREQFEKIELFEKLKAKLISIKALVEDLE